MYDREQTAVCPHIKLLPMARKLPAVDHDLDAQAEEALQAARSMPYGPEKVEALKRGGLLRRAADARGIAFAKLGRPRKTR